MKYKHKNLLNFIEKFVYVSKKDYNNFSSRYEYIKVICLTFLLGYNELVKCANPKCNKKFVIVIKINLSYINIVQLNVKI